MENKFLILIFSIVINIICVSGLKAQEPAKRILSLKEVLQIASEHDIRLILSKERIIQAVTRIENNKSFLYPQLNINTYEKRQTRDLRSGGFTFGSDPVIGPFNSFDARVQLTQTIFDASTLARLKSAQAGKDLSEAELKKAKEDVLALIADMFINSRREQQRLVYAESVLARETKKLNIVKSRFENGMATDLDIKQAQAGFDAAINFKKTAETRALNSRFDLLASLDLDLNQPVEFSNDDNLEFSRLPETSNDPYGKDLPEMEVAKQELLVSQQNQQTAKAEYVPKVSASADYGLSGIKPSDSSETYGLGIQATLPIFDGGMRRSNVKEAESKLKASEANVRDVKNKLNAKIIQIHESIDQAALLVAEKESKLDSLEKELALTQKRLADGTATELDLLNILAQEAFAQDEKNEAEVVLLTARINWAHVLGKMESLITDYSMSKEKNP